MAVIKTRYQARRRGQAVVELALASLLLVVIVVGGIYFGEIGMLNIKVTEATAAAVWDATGRPAHRYSDAGRIESRLSDVASETESLIGSQYRYFDGRDLGQGNPPSFVFVTAEPLRVECDEYEAAGLGPNAVLEFHAQVEAASVFSDENHGGVNCRATTSASLIPGRAPQEFHTDTGWLSGPILRSAELPMCGVGRAWGGACNAVGVPILLGEWGLSNRDNDEHEECHLEDRENCSNPGYFAVVKKLYDGPLGFGSSIAAGSAMVMATVQVLPMDFGAELDFWLSFRGEESQFSETLSNTMGRPAFTTTPGGETYDSTIDHYKRAYEARRDAGRCWLGMRCEDY